MPVRACLCVCDVVCDVVRVCACVCASVCVRACMLSKNWLLLCVCVRGGYVKWAIVIAVQRINRCVNI